MVLACQMVTEYFLPEMLDVIDRLQDDVKIYQVEKVSTTLRRKGGVMTHSQLLHDTKLKSKEFAECISTLIESKTIEPIKEEKSKIVYYRMLNHNNSNIAHNFKKTKFSKFWIPRFAKFPAFFHSLTMIICKRT